jgi:hypothetical protein
MTNKEFVLKEYPDAYAVNNVLGCRIYSSFNKGDTRVVGEGNNEDLAWLDVADYLSDRRFFENSKNKFGE